MKQNCRLVKEGDLLLFSHGLTGHRDSWLRIFARDALIKGRTIHFVVGVDHSNMQFLEILVQEFGQTLCLHSIHNGSHGIEAEILCLRSEFPGLTIATWEGEEWLKLLLKLRINLRILFMRPYIQNLNPKGAANFFIKYVFIFTFRHFSGNQIGLLAIPGDTPKILRNSWVDDVQSDYDDYKFQLSSYRERLRDEIGISSQAKIILVPGFITKRKNPQLAIEAFGVWMEKRPKNKYVLVFGGKLDKESERLVAKLQGKGIYALNRYLSKAEYFALLEEANLVLLLYSNRASSGVVIDAITVSTPVLLIGDKRWQNLFERFPELVARASRTPKALSNEIQVILSKHNQSKQKRQWREDRKDVIEFFNNT